MSDTPATSEQSEFDATTQASPDSTATSAPVAAATASETDTNATASTRDTGDLDCLDFWSEAFVQTTAGSEFIFMDMNIDGTLCAFTAIPSSIGVFFRPGDQSIFDAAKSGASAAGGVTDMDGVCDDAWYTDLGAVIAEGFSAGQGRIFNATILGPADPVAVAEELLKIACGGPSFG